MFELSPQDWTAVQLSLRVAAVSTLVALPFGIAIATLLARKEFWGKALLDAIVHLPLVLPPVVTGYLLLISFGRRAPIGAFLDDHFGIVFSFRWTGAALACGVMAFPLMVRAIRLSIEAIDRRLEDAAETLGANPALDLCHRDAAAGVARCHRGHDVGFCACARRIRRHDYFRVKYSGRDPDISAAIYTLTQVPGGDADALKLVIVSIIISFAALLASEWFSRRAAARLHGA